MALRRGLSANHQMLAIVPSVTAVAATGLTTLREPLLAMAAPYPASLGGGRGRDLIWGLQDQTLARSDRSSLY